MSKVIIGVGVVAAAAGVAYFIYSKNKKEQALINSSFAPTPTANITAATQTQSAPTPAPVKQTMWKDKDGNVFQLTSDKGQWGYYIKVNGSVHKKWNMMETMFLRSDGHVVGADNNGSVYEWKNNQWNYLIKDNKTQADQYLKQHGQLPIFSLNGLGCYLMS